MRVLILGFGELARDIGAKIKAFPEYDKNGEVYIYHFHVSRNSLSYGPELVVEIPDPHGDGYRTYNDGFQAVERYSTTVSDYDDWLIGEAEQGSFDFVIDCTSETESAEILVAKLQAATGGGVTYYRRQPADTVIESLRQELDGGKPWTPVQFNEETLEEARVKAEEAAIEMEKLHEVRRKAMVEARTDQGETRYDGSFTSFEGVLDKSDLESVRRFIVDGEGNYNRKESRDARHGCTIIEHEMLDWFFGPHKVLDVGMQLYLETDIKITSVRYIKYDSLLSLPIGCRCKYSAEYIIDQDKPWLMSIGENTISSDSGRMYPVPSKALRVSLGESGGSYVEMLVFHFDTNGTCNCY